MHVVCVKYGFCGTIKNGAPLHVDNFIPKSGLVTADQFVEWVFLAEDINPNFLSPRWLEYSALIQDAFIEYMGSDSVEAHKLKWNVIKALEVDVDP